MSKRRHKNPSFGMKLANTKFPFAKTKYSAFLMGVAASWAMQLYIKQHTTKDGKFLLPQRKKKKAKR